jgi:16S rRNA (guanine527-N7)-methyltransferase
MAEPVIIEVDEIKALLDERARKSLFVIYIDLIMEYNSRVNLVSRQLNHHDIRCIIMDSLLPYYFILLKEGDSVLDLGSGSGLCGIPLAITCPNINFTLAESNQKKAAFLRKDLDVLSIKNATVWEKYLKPVDNICTEKFKIVCVKAVTDLTTMCYASSGLLISGGKVIAFKGKHIKTEQNQLVRKCRDFSMQKKIDYVFKCATRSRERSLVIIEKNR